LLFLPSFSSFSSYPKFSSHPQNFPKPLYFFDIFDKFLLRYIGMICQILRYFHPHQNQHFVDSPDLKFSVYFRNFLISNA